MKDKVVPGLNGAGMGLIRNDVGYSRIEPPFAVPVPAGLSPYNGWTGTFPNANSQGQLWGRFDQKRVLVSWLDSHVSFPPIQSLRGQGTTEDEVNRGRRSQPLLERARRPVRSSLLSFRLKENTPGTLSSPGVILCVPCSAREAYFSRSGRPMAFRKARASASLAAVVTIVMSIPRILSNESSRGSCRTNRNQFPGIPAVP